MAVLTSFAGPKKPKTSCFSMPSCTLIFDSCLPEHPPAAIPICATRVDHFKFCFLPSFLLVCTFLLPVSHIQDFLASKHPHSHSFPVCLKDLQLTCHLHQSLDLSQ